MEILPLMPDRLPDLAQLFGEGGDPKTCWCAFFRVRAAEFVSTSSTNANRRILEGAVGTTAAEDRAPGLICYRDGKAIGWVSLGPRTDYERLMHSRVLAPVDERPAWSIVCFVVSRQARGQGVAKALLAAAVDYARDHGATLIEGYPIDTSGGRVAAAKAYTGTVGMFEAAGFKVVARRRASPTSRERPIMRRRLRARRVQDSAGSVS